MQKNYNIKPIIQTGVQHPEFYSNRTITKPLERPPLPKPLASSKDSLNSLHAVHIYNRKQAVNEANSVVLSSPGKEVNKNDFLDLKKRLTTNNLVNNSSHFRSSANSSSDYFSAPGSKTPNIHAISEAQNYITQG